MMVNGRGNRCRALLDFCIVPARVVTPVGGRGWGGEEECIVVLGYWGLGMDEELWNALPWGSESGSE